MKELLPLGSIVKLRKDGKKLLIYGRAQVAKQTGKRYDYLACLYPQGFFQPDMLLCFNHEQIEEVVFRGYADEEETAYLQRMSELMEACAAAQQTALEKQENE